MDKKLMLIGFFVFVQIISTMGGPISSSCPESCCHCKNDNKKIRKVCYHYGNEESSSESESKISKENVRNEVTIEKNQITSQTSSLTKEEKLSIEELNKVQEKSSETTRKDNENEEKLTATTTTTTTTKTPCAKFNATACIGGICKIVDFVDKKIDASTNSLLPSPELVSNIYGKFVDGYKIYTGLLWKTISSFCKLKQLENQVASVIN